MTVLLSKVCTPGWTFLMFTLNNTVQLSLHTEDFFKWIDEYAVDL